jgi:hypothetical protein
MPSTKSVWRAPLRLCALCASVGSVLALQSIASADRLMPAPNRFPSAANEAGFKPLADKVHGMGLLARRIIGFPAKKV